MENQIIQVIDYNNNSAINQHFLFLTYMSLFHNIMTKSLKLIEVIWQRKQITFKYFSKVHPPSPKSLHPVGQLWEILLVNNQETTSYGLCCHSFHFCLENRVRSCPPHVLGQCKQGVLFLFACKHIFTLYGTTKKILLY